MPYPPGRLCSGASSFGRQLNHRSPGSPLHVLTKSASLTITMPIHPPCPSYPGETVFPYAYSATEQSSRGRGRKFSKCTHPPVRVWVSAATVILTAHPSKARVWVWIAYPKGAVRAPPCTRYPEAYPLPAAGTSTWPTSQGYPMCACPESR
jgi:hypothetical protein